VKIGQIGQNLKWKNTNTNRIYDYPKNRHFLFLLKKDEKGRKKVKENKAM